MTLDEVIQDVVQKWARASGNAEEAMDMLSEKLGQSKPWLYNALNPHDTKHKLSPSQLMTIMDTCDDWRPLEHMAARAGRKIVSQALIIPDGVDMNDECMQGVEATTAYLQAVRDQRQHYTEVMPLLDQAIEELEECLVRKRLEQSSRVKVVGRVVGAR